MSLPTGTVIATLNVLCQVAQYRAEKLEILKEKDCFTTLKKINSAKSTFLNQILILLNQMAFIEWLVLCR